MNTSDDIQIEGDRRGGERASSERKLREVSLQRKLQNRLAQRKFRARAKLRKESLRHTAQSLHPDNKSSDPSYISQIPVQLQHCPDSSLPNVSGFDSSACWGQNVPLPDTYSDNAMRRGLWAWPPELLSKSQTLESSNETNVQMYQPYSQMPRPIRNENPENSNAIVNDSQSIVNDTTDGKATAALELSSKRVRYTPHLIRTADNGNEEEIKENAVATLLKQKVTLSTEGKELFDKISELYHLGVILEVIPRDAQFIRLFSSARERFFSSLESSDSLVFPNF
ncbi:hypothetical protein OAory_01072930 [Aspergillus oryzae]|uniref:BZIP domain-containing protein n=1 Tax=Aspergillus oryzae TaxID=5062 RepID=A0A1S9DP09_ASPOZ|nr:hypothetical protein OAory_01072930 [Aspergillus oryzae]